jgi:predicted nucleic acid-binding protein
MYVAGREHPNRGPADRFLSRVRSGDVSACTSTEVLQEILHRYRSLGRADLAFAVYDAFVQLCPEVLPVTVADTDRARQLLESSPEAGVRDAIHAAVMLNNDVAQIATFDRGFDRIPGVRRTSLD